MAPTEGRVAKPERRWDCHRGTPNNNGVQRPTKIYETGFIGCYEQIRLVKNNTNKNFFSLNQIFLALMLMMKVMTRIVL